MKLMQLKSNCEFFFNFHTLINTNFHLGCSFVKLSILVDSQPGEDKGSKFMDFL